MLSTVTGKLRTKKAARALLGGNYCMTADAVLKMAAIFVRVRCGVPVCLMGECGCGKTELIRFVCAFLDVRLFVLNCHGGTSEADVLGIFSEAEAALAGTAGSFLLDDAAAGGGGAAASAPGGAMAGSDELTISICKGGAVVRRTPRDANGAPLPGESRRLIATLYRRREPRAGSQRETRDERRRASQTWSFARALFDPDSNALQDARPAAAPCSR